MPALKAPRGHGESGGIALCLRPPTRLPAATGAGRGFTYYDWKGNVVDDAKLRDRFSQLVIPPGMARGVDLSPGEWAYLGGGAR